ALADARDHHSRGMRASVRHRRAPPLTADLRSSFNYADALVAQRSGISTVRAVHGPVTARADPPTGTGSRGTRARAQLTQQPTPARRKTPLTWRTGTVPSVGEAAQRRCPKGADGPDGTSAGGRPDRRRACASGLPRRFSKLLADCRVFGSGIGTAPIPTSLRSRSFICRLCRCHPLRVLLLCV